MEIKNNHSNKIIRSERATIEQLLFFIYFGLMLICKGIGLVDGTAYKAVLLAASVIAILKLLIGKYCRLEFMVILGLLALGAAIWFNSGNQGVLICLILLVSMKNVDIHLALREGALVWTATFLFQIVTQITWLRQRDFVVHSKFGLGYIVRWALGYSHPNVLMISYVVLMVYLFCFFCPRGRKLIAACVLSLAGGFFIFMYSLSVTGLLFLVIFLSVVLFLEMKGTGIGIPGRVILRMVFPLAVILSVIGPVLFRGKLFAVFDKILNTRFSLSRYFLKSQYLSLLGTDAATKTSGLTLDCSYSNLLICGGILVFALMVLVYWFLIKDMTDHLDIPEYRFSIAGTLSLIIAGISEPFLFNTSFKNVTFLFLGEYLFQLTAKYGQKEFGTNIGLRKIEIWIIPSICNLISHLYCIIAGTFRRSRKWLIIGSVSGALIFGVIYQTGQGWTTRFIVPRASSDADDNKENVYLSIGEIEELNSEPGTKVLKYTDEITPMQIFDDESIGNAEHVRGLVSSSLAGVFVGMTIVVILYSIRNRKKYKRYTDLSNTQGTD